MVQKRGQAPRRNAFSPRLRANGSEPVPVFEPCRNMITNRLLRCRIRRRGFTMIESLMAVAITTIAGAALLASVGSAVQSTSETTRNLVAQGLAEQLLDEIAASRFPTDTTTAPAQASVAQAPVWAGLATSYES